MKRRITALLCLVILALSACNAQTTHLTPSATVSPTTAAVPTTYAGVTQPVVSATTAGNYDVTFRCGGSDDIVVAVVAVGQPTATTKAIGAYCAVGITLTVTSDKTSAGSNAGPAIWGHSGFGTPSGICILYTEDPALSAFSTRLVCLGPQGSGAGYPLIVGSWTATFAVAFIGGLAPLSASALETLLPTSSSSVPVWATQDVPVSGATLATSIDDALAPMIYSTALVD